MDDVVFKEWADQLRKEDKFWYKGFRWGVFCGFSITMGLILLIGWFASPGV